MVPVPGHHANEVRDPGGVGEAMPELHACDAEKRRKRLRVVGNLRLDQQPRGVGNTKQLADRRTAAPGDRERGLTAGRVQRGDQLLPRGVRRAHGECQPLLCLKAQNVYRTRLQKEKQRVSEMLARTDAQHEKLSGQLSELEATERVLACYSQNLVILA
jgi:hypothetical protein